MSSVSRSLEKFRKSLENGTFYEAQQLVKTVYHRLRSRQLLEDSRELLEKASCLQLQYGQVTCATELAKLLIEAYGEDRLPAGEAEVGRILRILDGYEASTSSSPVDYSTVGKAAIKWLRAANGPGELVSELHQRIGEYMWQREGLKGLWQAIAHFARSLDMKRFSQMLLQASKEFGSDEAELLSARALLHLLNVPGRRQQEQTELARALLFELQRVGCIYIDGPMAHFLSLLIEAVERKSLPLVKLLQKEYAPTLEKDPGIATELSAIEVKYCGAQVGQGMGGLFGGMLRSLMAAE